MKRNAVFVHVYHTSILFVLVTVNCLCPPSKSKPMFLEQLSPFLWVPWSLCTGFLGLSPKVSCLSLAQGINKLPEEGSLRSLSKPEIWVKCLKERKLVEMRDVHEVAVGWPQVPVATLLLFNPRSAPSASLHICEPLPTLSEIPLFYLFL